MATRAMESILKKFHETSTPNISDALDKLSVRGGCEGISSRVEQLKLVGRAFTVHYIPVSHTSKGSIGDFLDDVKAGEVVVIDNAGRTYCTVWGDIMTFAAKKRGVAGTVIDGACRDLDEIKKMQYPVFSRAKFMVTGKDRVQVESVGKPVSISGVQVKPGDIIVGDDSGVVVVPSELEQEVVTIVEDILKTESAIMKDLSEGKSLAETRARHKYHMLQRPSS